MHGVITTGFQEPTWKSCCSCISQRWMFTILASFGLCIQNALSVIISMTIIEMVVKNEVEETQVEGSCRSSSNIIIRNHTLVRYDSQENASIQRFDWDEYTQVEKLCTASMNCSSLNGLIFLQGLILSSLSWSNVIVQFLYGSLSERFGGKLILGFGILSQAVITFITPFVVNWGGSTALITTRVLIGLGSDGMYPVVSTMIPNWSAPEERTIIGNTIYSGPVLGLFFGNIIPVLIMQYSGMGWPAVFYFFGLLGIVWFPFWLLLVYETPEVHPFISENEFNHLKINSDVDKTKIKLPATPWKHIFLCTAFWAFTINYVGGNWAYYLMLSDLPKYMGEVVKFSLESNGYFSALPYLLMWFNTIFSGWLNDKILEKQWMSLTNVRKLLATVSVMGPGIFILLASYAECDKTTVVIMFMIGITLIGGFYTSIMMNPLDLSPNYAGSIMSAGSGISSFVGILAPYLVGVLAPNSSIAEWRIVFWIVFLFGVISNAVYLVSFKAEIQPWDDPNFKSSKTKLTTIGVVDEKVTS